MSRIQSFENFRKGNLVNIIIIVPQYPFGKDQIYFPGSAIAIAARLMAMGYTVTIVDLNIDRLESASVQELLRMADLVGISLTGSPNIPGMFTLIPKLQKLAPNTTILLGGQVIQRLTTDQFAQLFGGFEKVVQIKEDKDLAIVLGRPIPPLAIVSFVPVLQRMGEKRVVGYLKREGTLIISQKCKYNCAFCGAEKGGPELFLRSLENFRLDLEYLVALARRHGLKRLEFYASSLDFFQNPQPIQKYLEILAKVREETGMDVRVRCLSCLKSFVGAKRKIPNLKNLLHRAGLWCIGFGSDGTDEEVWKTEKKQQNTVYQLLRCIVLCRKMEVRAEILMVFGFPEETFRTLMKTVWISLWAVKKSNDLIIRPYLAKPFIPGNEGWMTDQAAVERVLKNPRLFYNLDFCAIGSRLTHPRIVHRLLCNAAYLFICAVLTPIGKCTTSPLLPQGRQGLRGWLASIVNRWIPFDR